MNDTKELIDLLRDVREACKYAYTISRALYHEEEIGRNALHTVTQKCGKAVGAIDSAIATHEAGAEMTDEREEALRLAEKLRAWKDLTTNMIGWDLPEVGCDALNKLTGKAANTIERLARAQPQGKPIAPQNEQERCAAEMLGWTPASPPAQAVPVAYAVRYENASADILQWQFPQGKSSVTLVGGSVMTMGQDVAFYRELFAGPAKTLSVAPKLEGKG